MVTTILILIISFLLLYILYKYIQKRFILVNMWVKNEDDTSYYLDTLYYRFDTFCDLIDVQAKGIFNDDLIMVIEKLSFKSFIYYIYNKSYSSLDIYLLPIKWCRAYDKKLLDTLNFHETNEFLLNNVYFHQISFKPKYCLFSSVQSVQHLICMMFYNT